MKSYFVDLHLDNSILNRVIDSMNRDISKLDRGEQIELKNKLKSWVKVLQQISGHIQPIIQHIVDNNFLIMSRKVHQDVFFSLPMDEPERLARTQLITTPKPTPVVPIPTKIISQPKPFFKRIASGFLGIIGIAF